MKSQKKFFFVALGLSIIVLNLSILSLNSIQGKVVDDNPRVEVEDQVIVDDFVTINEVVSSGAGWLVVHNQSGSSFGAVLGYKAVSDGHNHDVRVKISQELRTTTLYAMLHTDNGTVGVYEFPGVDGPVKDTSNVVIAPAFSITSTLDAKVTVEDQTINGNNITVKEVISPGRGWMVIHADNNGAPGAILGHTPLVHGVNTNIQVELASEGRTETLYAMLHIDNGTIGTYEFPGADSPWKDASNNVITPSFKATAPAASGFDIFILIFGLIGLTIFSRIRSK